MLAKPKQPIFWAARLTIFLSADRDHLPAVEAVSFLERPSREPNVSTAAGRTSFGHFKPACSIDSRFAQTRWRGHMKPETSEHLNKVEGAIHGAKRLLGKHRYPDTMRTVLLSVLSIK